MLLSKRLTPSIPPKVLMTFQLAYSSIVVVWYCKEKKRGPYSVPKSEKKEVQFWMRSCTVLLTQYINFIPYKNYCTIFPLLEYYCVICMYMIRGDIKRGLTWLQSVYIRRFAREQLLFFVSTSIHNIMSL